MSTILISAILIAVSGLGGFVASYLHMPLPFMLGSLLVSGAIALFRIGKVPKSYVFPMNFRMLFMSVIGVTIGTNVTPEVLMSLPGFLPSFALLTVFTCVAHWANYQIFHRLGGYDKPTAFYAGTPGGLMESIALGEGAGANIAILTIQQFLRVIAVITFIPIGLSFWYGAPVGSAAGVSLVEAGANLSALPLVLLLGATGLVIGKLLRLPAGQLTGPMLIAAIVTVAGLAELSVPQWVINLCQVVIGTSLGMRFAGLNGNALIRAGWLSVLSVSAMLSLGLLCALILTPLTGLPMDVLLISFAPGGVTEMALIALSLQANPALVTMHHVYRIVLTVFEMTIVGRFTARNRQDTLTKDD